MGISAFCYFLIAFSILLNINWAGILIICLMISGFSQTVAYPIVIKLIYQHFSTQTDGFILGIWTASGDFGNITSFFLDTFLYYELEWPWVTCILFASFMTILMAVILSNCLIDTN